MKESLEIALQHAVDALLKEQGVEAEVAVQLTRPKQKEHGVYAANVAMPLDGRLNQPSRIVA
ncbi:MAG TPA: arginine--tRNA ligase, partial [Mariprofundaceae bacterium]|nr:arginine--tRNA ligase [Mariprofundaceae bacterium]